MGAKLREVRRRIRDQYYDRPEVRRILSRLILRQLARKGAGGTRKP